MMKKLLLFFIFINIFLSTGCWDRIEINDIALIMGVGLDKLDDNRIEITVEMTIPQPKESNDQGGSEGATADTMTRTGKGVNIAKALENLQEKLPRNIFWGQSEIIVIGEKLAKEGIRDKIDFFLRHEEPRIRSYVFVAKGSAKDVLSLRPPLEPYSSEVLRELSESEKLMNVTLLELLQMLKGESGATALPMISILAPEKEQSELETLSYINRTAVFKQDKMINDINDNITRGVLWLRDEIEKGHITVKPSEANEYISLDLITSNTEFIPSIKNDQWKITVNTSTKYEVLLNESNLDLEDPDNILMLEKEVEKGVEKRLKVTLDQVQKEMGADILNFAEIFYRKYPKKWNERKEDWNEIFPTVEVTYDIKANILRNGRGSAQD